jgi:hypothetical protein
MSNSSFDFEKYRKEQVKNTFKVGIIKDPHLTYIKELTITTSDSLVDLYGNFDDHDKHCIDVRRPTIHKYKYPYSIVLDNDDISPQESWNIYADSDENYNIIRIFAWHPDIIPFWGESRTTVLIPNHTNDIIITSYPKMFRHKASARVIRKLKEKAYPDFFLDQTKDKFRYIFFRLNCHSIISKDEIVNCRLHVYKYQKDQIPLEAFEIYILPEEDYLSYYGV